MLLVFLVLKVEDKGLKINGVDRGAVFIDFISGKVKNRKSRSIDKVKKAIALLILAII